MSHLSLAQSSHRPDALALTAGTWYRLDGPGLSASEFVPQSDSGSYLVMFGQDANREILNRLCAYLDAQGAPAKYVCVYQPWQGMAPGFCLYSESSSGKNHDKLELAELAQSLGAELAFLTQPPTLRQPGLLVMDMDSTAIRIECIDEIARLADVYDEVAAVTAAAMNGALEFSESLRLRVAKLAGIPLALVEQLKQDLPLMPGVAELCEVLKQHGWHLCIASGGFVPFAERVQEMIGLDEIHANRLEDDGTVLTGKVLGDIVDADEKARFLAQCRDRLGLDVRQTLAIGDGANDLKMMLAAGLGISIHGKAKVVAEAPVAISQGSLMQILYLLTLPVAVN